MTNDLAVAREMAVECLERWMPFSEHYLYSPPERPDLACFGSGYNNWGVQTNQKYIGSVATLAMWRSQRNGNPVQEDPAFARTLAALRHNLASHHTGDYHCTDGTRWGRTWISALGIERMMHGLDWLEPHLPEDLRRGVALLLADEADYQLGVPVIAGPWAKDGRNKPESNIWNGAICARAALHNPDHPHTEDWMQKAHEYWLNGISVPADAEDDTVIAGRPLRQWHRGASFFPHYALDHHGYLNVGYMVICLSNVAMLHYSYRLQGLAAPPSLYHHAKDLWDLVRRLVFADGRLLRIGGDTRIRYCYCQDYLLPTLVLAADHWGDPHATHLLRGAVDLVRREQEDNADGSFVSGRLGHIARENPYYYTRLESDRSVALSMVMAWLTRTPLTESGSHDEASLAGGWCEPEHGAVLHRCPTRVASWSWRAAEPPQGLCLPPDRSDLAEWAENLAGSVRAIGQRGKRTVERYTIQRFDGGFLTAGQVLDGTDVQLAEGWKADFSARHRLVFAALPDGHTVVRLEVADLAPRRVYLENWAGVNLHIPNDLYNGRVRRYATAAGPLELRSHVGPQEVLDLASPWVNVDDAIGVIGIYGAETWNLLRPGKPTGGYAYGNILVDTLCYGLQTEPCDRTGPARLLDNACLILSSVDSETTARQHADGHAVRLPCADSATGDAPPDVRAVRVLGLDRREYVLVASFADTDRQITVGSMTGRWTDLASGEPFRADQGSNLNLNLKPAEAQLLLRH
jgi:hypothetical protein